MAEYRTHKKTGQKLVLCEDGRWRKVRKNFPRVIDSRPAVKTAPPKPSRVKELTERRMRQHSRRHTHVSPEVYRSLHSRFYKEFYGYGKQFRRMQDAISR